VTKLGQAVGAKFKIDDDEGLEDDGEEEEEEARSISY
jgi:hypothetical protein